MTAALEGGEWSAARPGRTLPLGKTRYPFYRRPGGPQGRSGRAENLVPPRDSIPDRPARSSVAILTELHGTLYIIHIIYYIYIHTHIYIVMIVGYFYICSFQCRSTYNIYLYIYIYIYKSTCIYK